MSVQSTTKWLLLGCLLASQLAEFAAEEALEEEEEYLLLGEEQSLLEEDSSMATPWTTSGWRSFMVELGYLSTASDHPQPVWVHYCAASLIRRTYPAILLTSAHCVYYKDSGMKWSNHAGYYAAFHKPGKNMKDAILARIARVEYVKAYDSEPNAILGDVALVFLDLSLAGLAYPALIPTAEQYHKIVKERGTQAKIVGWDAKKNGDLRLGDTNVDIVSLSDCRKIFGVRYFDEWSGRSDDEMKDPLTKFSDVMQHWNEVGQPQVYEVYNDEFCALDMLTKRNSNCNGDSGAPMMALKTGPGLATLLGVTSGGLVGGCQPHLPVIYSRIDFYRDWIQARYKCTVRTIIDYFESIELRKRMDNMKKGFFRES